MPLPPKSEPGNSAHIHTCPYHPGRPAVSICDGCGRKWCTECIEDAGDLHLCPECRQKRLSHIRNIVMLSGMGLVLVAGVVSLVLWHSGRASYAVSDRLVRQLAMKPGDERLRLKTARTLWAQGRRKQALDIMQWFVKSGDWTPHGMEAVRTLMAMRDYDGALTLIRSLLKSGHKEPELMTLEGTIWKEKGKSDECIRIWTRVLSVTPGNLSLRISLADVLVSRGRVDQARKVLTEGLRYAGDNPLRAQLEKKLLSLIKRSDATHGGRPDGG